MMLSVPQKSSSNSLLDQLSEILQKLSNENNSTLYVWFLKREFKNLCSVAHLYNFTELEQQKYNSLLYRFMCNDIEKPLLGDF